jgi:hypothetical protein
MNNNYSLVITGEDGSTKFQTDVDFMHLAFQRLIDWSIDKLDEDASATISGPNGFRTCQRIKASPDFSWIEKGRPIQETYLE